MLIIENSYISEKEAKEACRKLEKAGYEPWVVTGRTGRPMVALEECRNTEIAQKKVMEYFHAGILTAIWREDKEL